MNNTEYEFIKKGDIGVWENIEHTSDFTKKDVKYIQKDFQEYLDGLDIDLDKELERIRMYQKDKSRRMSPVWSRWGADHSVRVAIDFDYSSGMKEQRAGVKDKDKRISDSQEPAFLAALMCCDTPSATMAVLFRCFADEMGLSIGDRLKHFAKMTRYVELQMQIAFICKWKGKFPRPSDYEVGVGLDKTVSLIPHPNHPSLPEGHGTYGFAIRKYFQNNFMHVPPAIAKACEEVGLARIDCGIHWFMDQDAAERNVERYDELVQKYM